MKNAIPYIEDIQFIRKTDFLILWKPVLEEFLFSYLD